MKRAKLFAATLALASLSSPAFGGVVENKATASRVLVEKMGRGDFSKLHEIYGPGFVAHASSKSFTLEEDNESGRAIRTAVPDLQVFVDRIFGEGEMVAVHWSARGTNSVAAAGLPGSGRRIKVEGMTIFRFEEGRIVEEWSLTDQLSILRQLGAL